eukprot:SAG31_NODE_3371_length_4353_cov_3.023507_2_plen_149_part_00
MRNSLTHSSNGCACQNLPVGLRCAADACSDDIDGQSTSTTRSCCAARPGPLSEHRRMRHAIDLGITSRRSIATAPRARRCCHAAPPRRAAHWSRASRAPPIRLLVAWAQRRREGRSNRGGSCHGGDEPCHARQPWGARASTARIFNAS